MGVVVVVVVVEVDCLVLVLTDDTVGSKLVSLTRDGEEEFDDEADPFGTEVVDEVEGVAAAIDGSDGLRSATCESYCGCCVTSKVPRPVTPKVSVMRR